MDLRPLPLPVRFDKFTAPQNRYRSQEGLQQVVLEVPALIFTYCVYTFVIIVNGAGEQLFEAVRADVRILGDGFFAFDRDRLFYPVPRRLTDASDPIAEGIQVIYTPYLQPADLGDGWKHVQGRYRLATEAGQSIRMVLSAPGITTRTGSVDVRAGAIRYLRPPLTWNAWLSIVHRELRAAWHRI